MPNRRFLSISVKSGDFGDLNHRNRRIAAFWGISVQFGDFGDLNHRNRRNLHFPPKIGGDFGDFGDSGTHRPPPKPQKCSRLRGRVSPTLPNPRMLRASVGGQATLSRAVANIFAVPEGSVSSRIAEIAATFRGKVAISAISVI